MTASTRRRPLTAALGCLGLLLAAVFVAPWSAAAGTTAGSAWTTTLSDEAARLRVADPTPPQLGVLPRLGNAAARVAVPVGADLGGWFGGYMALAALVGGLLAASGPRPLRPRVGSKQHGTRAPPSWSALVG